MKKVLLVACLLASQVCFAQQATRSQAAQQAAQATSQAPQPPSEAEMNGRLATLQGQRNEANDRLAFVAGQLAEMQRKLTEAQSAAAACAKPEEKK